MKKLRKKIILAAFLSVTAVFLLTLVLVMTALSTGAFARADQVTQLIDSNDGKIPMKGKYDNLKEEDRVFLYNYDEESPFRFRYFVVNYNGDSYSVDVEHIAAVDESAAKQMAAEVVAENDSETGNYDYFRYRKSEETNRVIFLDISDELDNIWAILIIMSIVSAAFVILITVVFYFASNRVVRPFEENSRMQKQFITDASHELKTPIAIISANAEVLAYKDGENEWINNITTQVARISGLIDELLTLNRLEEIDTNVNVEPVNLSNIVTEISGEFAEIFASKNARLDFEIDADVILNGNSDQLRRLSSVLIENASKYVTENGEAKVALRKGARHTTLSVFNSCELDESVDYSNLFERFYRPDSSRASKTGGHGVGLSIAKRIVTLHNGTIEAVPENGGLCFKATISNRLKPGRKKSQEKNK